ncbi:MAG: DMT family transporter [Verrucomicrobiae bacterium]|nr:DMT family transporter [Verrucomicrobiae bacterium]
MPAWWVWTCIALGSWGIWAVLSRGLGEALSAGGSQALSTLGMLPLLGALAVRSRGAWRKGAWRGIGLAMAGGTVTCLGNVAYYGVLGRGEKVATVVSLTAMYPLVTVLLAVWILGERLNRVQCLGLGLSLAAIWLFNGPGGGGWLSSAVVLALVPIALWGMSGFLQKVATRHVVAELAAFCYLLAYVPVGMVLAWRESWPEAMTGEVWGLGLALGFFLALGNASMLAAYARGGKAAVVAPLSGLYPVVSVPIAVLVLGERIGVVEGLGILCALASVVALSRESPAVPIPADQDAVSRGSCAETAPSPRDPA